MKASAGALALLAVGAAALARPFFSQEEMFAAFDSPTHLHWAASFRKSLGEGNLYPRWHPEAFGGYGAPTFVFYPAVPYYAATAFFALGPASAVKLSLALALFLSGAAQFFFLRDLTRPAPALVGAAAYMALPAHLFQASPFFLLSSLWALVFLPVAFWGARRAARNQGVLGLALGAGGLLASHLPTSATGLPVAVLFGWLGADRGQKAAALAALGRGIAWGAALGAVYWLPALFESPFIQARYHVEWNRLEDNFLYARSHPLGEGYLAVNHLISVAATLAAALSIFSYLAVGVRVRGVELRFFAALACGSFLLMTPLGRVLWNLVPFARWLEFPWRLVNLELLAASSLLALGFARRPTPCRPNAIWRGLTVATLAINLLLSALLERELVFFTPQVERTALETGIYDVVAFLPKEAPPPPGKYQRASRPRRPEAELAQGEAQIRVIHWGAEKRRLEVDAPGPATLRLRLFFFPGWEAELGGREATLRVEPETGAVLVDVPEGRRELQLRFGRTGIRRLAGALSSLGLLGLAFVAAGRMRKKTAAS